MREFFRGWKRKLGVVTLAMACVVAIPWIRSLCVYDQFEFDGLKYSSANGAFSQVQQRYGTMPDGISQYPFYEPVWRIAYWPIVLPLTLLSAYLLLSKPKPLRGSDPPPPPAT